MRKLMWFSVGFVLAATLGIYFLHDNWYFLASGIASLCLGAAIYLVRKFSKFRMPSVIILGCFLGFLWMTLFEVSYLSVPRVLDEKKLDLTITATEYSHNTEYGCVVEGIGKINNRYYKVTVYLPEESDVAPGDQLTGRFSLRTTLPGYSGESHYSFSRGIFLTAKMSRMPDIDTAEKLPWYGYPAFVRQTIKNLLNAAFPEDTAGFSIALLLGDSDGIDYRTDSAFKISGIRHVIAVSGLHVTILFSLVHTLLGKKRCLSAAVGIPVLFFFASIVGFTPSISRACLMHGLMIIGSLFDKEYDPLTALGFAALCMITINPWTVANVSFQLSVMCMLGILLLSDKIKIWLMDRTPLRRCKGKVKKVAGGLVVTIAMSIGANVFVAPLSAYYFDSVSLIGVVSNLLNLWVISFIFYGIMAACALALIWVPLGSILAAVVSLPIRYVLAVSNLMAQFPLAAVFADSIFIVMWLIFAYILLIVNLLSKQKKPLISFCCAIIGLSIAVIASWAQPIQDECRVSVLDVGQGQCILLQSEGKTYMVDCGGDSDTVAADVAANALLSQGVYRLDGIILTHFDADHAGGVANLLERIPADIIVMPEYKEEEVIDPFWERFDLQPLIIDSIIDITFGETKIQIIPSKNDHSDNEGGLCVLFQTKNCDILITGDRSASGERELMREISLPDLEVLIVGHHGSRFSTSNALLELTTPEIAIISVGADNAYGHPAEETLDRLRENGCEIYRTDQHGTVIFRR